MLQSLDIFTLGICSMLASTAFGTVFLTLWIRRPSERHLRDWGLSNWLYAVVLLGLYSPASANPVVSALFFALTGVSDVLTVTGVYRIEQERPFRRWMILPPAATTIGHILPSLLGAGATSIISDCSEAVGLGLAMGMCGFATLHRRAGSITSRGRQIAGLAQLAYLIGYLAVIVIRIGYPDANALLPRIPMLADQLLLGLLALGLLAIPAERAHQRLREQASRDPLTGAWNRTGLGHLGADLVQIGSAVIAFDIDHFKTINDKHGHSAGDEVLVAVAKAVRETIEPYEGQLFRVGGDEFIAILPRCAAADAEDAANRLRHFEPTGRHLSRWTLSIGIALLETSAPPMEEAIHQADVALYRAKALGRGRAEYVTI